MEESVALYLVMLIFLEFFEILWQKGNTFKEYLANLFYFYRKNMLFFLLLHPTLFFSFFAQISLNNYGFLASSLSLIKIIDLCTKIYIMDKLYKKQNLVFISETLDTQISPLLKSAGLIIYVTLFFFAYA
ncbi:MAG TPA: hypothetical protein CFH79_00285 [Sulfurospirillum sp. UBA11407]|nr:MAG TPA: hypothetical protein CFH79_00285 [Sulfurospirillum sp. UBA11407]